MDPASELESIRQATALCTSLIARLRNSAAHHHAQDPLTTWSDFVAQHSNTPNHGASPSPPHSAAYDEILSNLSTVLVDVKAVMAASVTAGPAGADGPMLLSPPTGRNRLGELRGLARGRGSDAHLDASPQDHGAASGDSLQHHHHHHPAAAASASAVVPSPPHGQSAVTEEERARRNKRGSSTTTLPSIAHMQNTLEGGLDPHECEGFRLE
jgi:hypothetical protein